MKAPFLKLSITLAREQSIRFQKTFQLHGEFFCGQVIRNRKIIEGITEDEVICSLLFTIHHKPAAILIEGSDP